MAIIITDQYRLRQKNFLDDRLGLATSKDTLRDWDTSINPLPDGFEVCLEGIWYVYRESNPEDPETGKFSLRNLDNDKHLENIDKRLDDLEERTQIAHRFSDILTPEFWTTQDGVLHVTPGVTVSVQGDSDKSLNGLWYLSGSNYTIPSFWIKLVSRTDFITEFSGSSSNDISVYTSARVDRQFPAKSKEETISGNWEFTGENKITGETQFLGDTEVKGKTDILPGSKTTIKPGVSIEFGGDGKKLEVDLQTGKTTLEVDKIVATESDIEDLDDHILEKLGRIGIGNLLKGTSFLGSFQSETFSGDTIMQEGTQVWGDPADGIWEGFDYEFIDDPQSISGRSAKFLSPDGFLQQYPAGNLTPGESYTISWKQKGQIKVEFDGKTWENTTPGYEILWERFDYSGEFPGPVRFEGDTDSIVCEIKLEWGIVPTSWFPNCMDTDPVATRFLEYDYIKSSLTEKEDLGNIPQTLKLETMIQSSSRDNQVKGGVSGVYTGDSDIFLWSGGTYKESQDLLKEIKDNPLYWNKQTSGRGIYNPRAIISYKDLSVFSYINAFGDFFGKFYNSKNKQILPYGVTGVIPFLNASDDGNNLPEVGVMNFKDGFLVDTSLEPDDPDANPLVIYEYNGSVVPREMPHTSISFTEGLLGRSGRFILKVYTGDANGSQSRFQDGETFYLYLIFIDGYLLGVTKDEPDDNFYWY